MFCPFRLPLRIELNFKPRDTFAFDSHFNYVIHLLDVQAEDASVDIFLRASPWLSYYL